MKKKLSEQIPEERVEEYNCPRCGGHLYDVTELYELCWDAFVCNEDISHSFSPDYVRGFWDGRESV